MKRVVLLCLLLAAPAAAQEAHKSKPAPAGVKEYIVWPANGQVIKGGKFWLRMGLKGMGVAPAGVVWPNTGHHHVLIDTDPPPLDEPIPNDRNHLHRRLSLLPNLHARFELVTFGLPDASRVAPQ